jgi:triosephosphate isomerase
MTRQFFVGGNFKMNPASRDAKRALIKTLNDATLDPDTGELKEFLVPPTPSSRPNNSIEEVVIAPPALYLIQILDLLRKDVKVAAQNCHSKTSGAFTGEIRWASPDRPIFLV